MKYFLFVLLIFMISTLLFKKASGTLNPGKLNIISYVYYIFMLQSFIGTAFILLGFDKHYTLNYLLEREKSIAITIVVVLSVAIFIPLLILAYQKILKFNLRQEYQNFLLKNIEIPSSNVWWTICCLGSLICIMILIGFLMKIGYIPFLRLLNAPKDFDFGMERSRIASTYFIHPYISNIVLFSVIPLLSYLSFAYAATLKEKRWIILCIVLFLSSCICKTYKFEKSPIIFHLLIYVLIILYLKGGVKFIYMMLTGVIMGGGLIASYVAIGYTGTIFDIYNGPMGRTFFTEVGTLSYCFDLFPNVFGYLGGRSFTPTILKLIGIDSGMHLRSAKLTMAYYGSEKVYDGTAGVMNTLFVGEAYANWGYAGVVFSVIWVALVITLLMYLILKLKKTPAVITLLALMSVRIGTMLEGGFCDFVYSFELLFTIIVMLGIYFVFENDGNINCIIMCLIEKVKGKTRKWFKR